MSERLLTKYPAPTPEGCRTPSKIVMKFISVLSIAALVALAFPSEAQNQKGKGKGLRKQSEQQGNYRVSVIEIPEEMASKFERLKSKFLLYRPIETSQQKLPLVVTLHGSGGGRRDIEQKKWQGAIRQLLKPENQKYEAMLLEPQSGGEWEPDSLDKLLEFVICENPGIDTKRIYCVGYSMGGKGTWEWAMNYPERFAAISPKGFIPDLSKIKGMVDLPIWAMVGDKDSRPRVEGIPAMEKALREMGSTNVKISVFEGANHATAAGRARDEPGVFDWLFSWGTKGD
ncbi:MAG: dienelactone hydrolase family protein [Verrucomicrobiales bacterium]